MKPISGTQWIEYQRKRYDFFNRCVDAVKLVLGIIALSVVVWTFGWAVRPFAGETTTVNVAIRVGVILSLAVTPAVATAFVMYLKSKRQSEELIRMRARVDQLEKMNLKLIRRGDDSGSARKVTPNA